METVSGIFQSRAQAEDAVRELHSLGIPNDRIALLTPGMSDARVESAVPTADSEQPGMGEALGGTVGGAMGVAGGATLGAAAASLLVPGVGPVIAGGILGAALLGAGGTAAGIAAAAHSRRTVTGLPHDELYLYEAALRKGNSVVIALSRTKAPSTQPRAPWPAPVQPASMKLRGLVDRLRDAEETEYRKRGGDFADEANYRRGFERACQQFADRNQPAALPDEAALTKPSAAVMNADRAIRKALGEYRA